MAKGIVGSGISAWIPFKRSVALTATLNATGTIVLNWASDADLQGVNEVHISLCDFAVGTGLNPGSLRIDRTVVITGGSPPIPGLAWSIGSTILCPTPSQGIGATPLVFNRADGNVTFTFLYFGTPTVASSGYIYGAAH